MEKTHPVINETGHLTRFLSEKRVRASVVEMTDLVAAVCEMQKTSPSASIALGRTLVSAVLLASHTKEGHEVALEFSCNGPIRSIFAHAGYNGRVRGSVGDKNTPISFEKGVFSLKPLVQGGTMTVTTYVPRARQPIRSRLAIESGEIGEDVAHYLNQSMQIQNLVSLGVRLSPEDKVIAAGGVLVEMMPGYEPETLERILAVQDRVQTLSQMIEEKKSIRDLLGNYVGDLNMAELGRHEITYGCNCSHEKARSSIQLLGVEDVRQLVREGKGLVVNCEMCGLPHQLTIEDLNLVLKDLIGPAIH